MPNARQVLLTLSLPREPISTPSEKYTTWNYNYIPSKSRQCRPFRNSQLIHVRTKTFEFPSNIHRVDGYNPFETMEKTCKKDLAIHFLN